MIVPAEGTPVVGSVNVDRAFELSKEETH